MSTSKNGGEGEWRGEAHAGAAKGCREEQIRLPDFDYPPRVRSSGDGMQHGVPVVVSSITTNIPMKFEQLVPLPLTVPECNMLKQVLDQVSSAISDGELAVQMISTELHQGLSR